MSNISVILQFEDLFDEEPESIDFYLSGISKEYLLDYAIKNLSLSTILNNTNEILWAFFTDNDVEKDHYKRLIYRIQHISNTYKKDRPNLTILNVRSSLFFFEYIQKIKDASITSTVIENQIKLNLLKAYLLINDKQGFSPPEDNNELYTVIGNALTHSLYSGIDLIKLRLAELIKACLFFEYCVKNLPVHLEEFLKYYSINTWIEYTLYIHQIGMLVNKKTKKEPVVQIFIPESDPNYDKKVRFFDAFCMQELDTEDKDFTCIKSRPIHKDKMSNKYIVVFEQFFIEKMYKSLYFTFKEINDNLKGTPNYIKNIRSTLGEKFSENVLLNKILKEALGDKYKHLGNIELGDVKDTDYYIRDGKYILLFENKDNLIDKRLVDSRNIEVLIDKLKNVFICNEEGKDKAIKQLINNIEKIQNGNFVKDPGINPTNCIIYPIVVVDNSLFSLAGINMLINHWFSTEIQSRCLNTKHVRPLTIIDIDSLVLYQGLYSQKEYGLRHLIDDYWHRITLISKKKILGYETVDDKIMKYLSFKFYLDDKFRNENIFTKEITQYNMYFH